MKKTQQLISHLIQWTVWHRRFLLIGLILITSLVFSATQWRKTQNTQAAALPPAVCGTKSVGPGGNYATLAAAFADLNVNGVTCQVILELQANYTSAGETFPLQLNQVVGASAANTITIRPQAGATGLTITTSATGTFYLNGADFVIFDGRPGGVGSTKELTIENTQTSWGVALSYFNAATNNLVQYCKLKGRNPDQVGGVIFFDNGTNSNNTIDHCDVSADNNGLPYNLIYGKENLSTNPTSNITISNNNLYNFFPGSAVRAAGNGQNTAWTVTGNRIFQEAPRTGSYDQRVIWLDNATSGVFTVTNNVIGYAAADGTGTYTLQGNFPGTFIGINMTSRVSAPSVIEGNTIAGIALTGQGNRFIGINATQGTININSNTIGSDIAVNAIVNTNTVTGNAEIVGIYCSDNTSTVTKTVTNNHIGGLTLRGAAQNQGGSATGIYADTGRYTFSNNLVGSLTTPDSLRCGDAGATGGCSLTGMSLGGFVDTATYSDNTIANFKNNSTRADVRGIIGSAGTITVTGNLIRDLYSFGDLGPNNFPAVLAGMEISGGTGTIARNTAHSFANTNPAASNSTLVGIYLDKFTNTGGNATVERNFVHSLSRAAAGTPISGDGIAMKGILVFQAADRFIVRNNMVRLGIDANGNSVTAAMPMAGIMVGSVSPSAQVYFNSVYLGGAGVGASGGNVNSYAFFGESVNPRDYRDNIFVNSRSNAGSGAKHYAYRVSTTPPTSNYNLYLANGAGGVLAQTGGTDRTTLAALQSALTGQDLNSLVGDPFFINPNGTAATVNLHILTSACSPAADAGTPISGITIDFDNETRQATNPDIGADEFLSIPPPITIVPANQTACFGSTTPLPFAVMASGTNPSYMWTLDGQATGGNAANISINPSGLSPGNHVVAVMVMSSCGMASANATLTIMAPPAPNITASGPTTFCQGGNVMLTASAASSYLWSNGATTQSITVSASGNYSVTVTNANGCTGTSAPTSVTVNPLPTPTITASGPTTFCQGGSVMLTASAASSYLWSNGATTQSITVNTSGNYSVTVTDGNSCTGTSAATTVTVNPLPTPTITASGPTTFCQGGSVTLTASTASSYLWSNGATTQSITVSASGSYSVTVTNANGCQGTSSTTVVTVNPMPTATVSGTTAICPGASATLQVTLTGTGPWTLTWSDGFTQNVSSSPATRTVSPATTTTYSITTVTDANCSTAGSGSAVVTVNPATAITTQPTGLTRNVGQSATFSVTAGGASLTYQWRKNGTDISSATGSSYTIASVAAADAGNYDVVVSGLCGSVLSNVAVLTVNSGCGTPVVSITAPASGTLFPVGTPANFFGAFTDAAGQTHTANWNFTSNLVNVNQSGVINETAGTVSTSYSFTQAGVYLVTLTVTNNCGHSGSASTVGVDQLSALVVVYDPNAGHVTGGGWIMSPPGAYVPNPALTGKANFGFVSKYKNGASVPDGNTEFQFKAGNLNFKSTAYEWLVIAGARAQFKGSGTINNAGDYRFILTAIDGQVNGGGGQDKFRIKIWNNLGGGLVYDNQLNAPDNDDPTTVLGGGSIVIHKDGGGGNAAMRAAQAAGDFDGDGKTDFVTWDGEVGEWRIVRSSDGSRQVLVWGESFASNQCVFVPGDYDGDGRGDLAIFRRTDGSWLVRRSSDGEVVTRLWGLGTDTPVAADYDGDGKTDFAVWRGSEGVWHILRSSDGQVETLSWGLAAAPYFDVPVAADYDGDGKADLAVFRRANGHWLIKLSSNGAFVDKLWGVATDAPVPADYDGDGQADIAVWRGADTRWHILRSADNAIMTVSLGAAALNETPVTGDFDGDGQADAVIWRAGEGRWHVRRSRDGQTMSQTMAERGTNLLRSPEQR